MKKFFAVELPVLIGGLMLFALLFMLLPNHSAARPMGRTSVEGVWGLSPTTLTLTGTQTLTPSTSSYYVAPPTTVTYTLAVSNALAGDRLRFVSTVTTDTIFATAGTSLDATQTISDDDVLEFEFDGSAWVVSNLQNN